MRKYNKVKKVILYILKSNYLRAASNKILFEQFLKFNQDFMQFSQTHLVIQPNTNFTLCFQVSYAAEPAQQSQTSYSPAADVSSFSYSSPAVQYNSQGYLHQLAGKLSAAAPEPQISGAFSKSAFAASGTPVSFAAPAQKYTFASPAGAYSAVPKYQFAAAAPQQFVYAQAPAAAQYVPQQFAGGAAYAQLQAAQSQPVYAVSPSQFAAYSGKYATGGSGYSQA